MTARQVRAVTAWALALTLASCSCGGASDGPGSASTSDVSSGERRGEAATASSQNTGERPSQTGGLPEPPPVQELDKSACQQRASAMAAWVRLEGLPEGVGVLFSNGLAFDEGWTLEPAVEPPEVTSGWRRVKRRSVEVAIRADGALAFPEAARGAFAAGSAPAEGQGGSVEGVKGGAVEGQDEGPRRILVHDGDVQRLASDLPSQGHLVVVADRRAPVERVRELRAITPDSVTMSLAVSRTSKAVVAAFAQRWPRVPGWLVPRLHRASESANGNRVLAGAELLLLLKDRIGSCAAIEHAFELVRAGAGMDVLGQVLAEALQSCTCRGMDVDAVETIAAFSTLSISKVGVAKVWASDARAWGQLPADGTVSDLAAALTRE